MDCRHAVQVLSVINHEFFRLIDWVVKEKVIQPNGYKIDFLYSFKVCFKIKYTGKY